MKFYLLRVESAGDLGGRSIIENPKARPLVVTRFHYELDMWPTDDLLQAVGVFMASEQLVNKLKPLIPPVTGVSFDEVEVTTSDRFDEWHSKPGTETYRDKSKLPKYVWLKVSGRAGIDDFGLANSRLVVSDRVLSAMRLCVLEFCKVEDYQAGKLSAAG
jgi:hypothetical protein